MAVPADRSQGRGGLTAAADGIDDGPEVSEIGGRDLDAHPDDCLPTRVEHALRAYLGRRRGDGNLDPTFVEAVDALVAFVLGGGKRFRPTFAWWGWRGAGGSPADAVAPAVLQAISALELVQAGALLHDDLIDASATRRGRPTLHVAFAERHRAAGWAGPPTRFGAAAAILLGDLALAWADDMLHAAALPTAALVRVAEPWRALRTEVLGGQYLDVLAQAERDVSSRTALQIDRSKTAAYTVERPLHLGAAIAGGDDRLVRAYRRFGTDLGVAFQLRDDLLGVFGDPKVTGKPAGDDLREGKRTLLVALALQRADERGADAAGATLRAALGDPRLDGAAVDQIRGLLAELGAVQAVELRIAALTGAALDALSTAEVAEPAASRLADLALTATRRWS